MPKPTRRFGGLITPPEPLPEPEDEHAELTAAGERAAVPEIAGPGPEVVPAAPAPPSLASDDAGPADAAAEQASPPETGKPVVPTIRLHQPAARALRAAWLGERRIGDPTLSFPTFASEIVILGLAAFDRKRKRRSQP